MLFTMVNLARHLKVEPEFALRHTNAKFRRRFAAMEAASPQPLETLSADQLELLWSQAKAGGKLFAFSDESPMPAQSSSAIVIRPCQNFEEIERLRAAAGRCVGV
jgi:hypothetical protein